MYRTVLTRGSVQIKYVLHELQKNFPHWCPKRRTTPEKPLRSNSVMQSLKDLALVLRSTTGTPLDTPAEIYRRSSKPLGSKLPLSKAETILSGVTNIRASLKAGIASTLRASARSAFKRSLPALPVGRTGSNGESPAMLQTPWICHVSLLVYGRL